MSAVAAPVLDYPQKPALRRRHLHLVPASPARAELSASHARLTVRGRRALLGLVLAVLAMGAWTMSSFASGPAVEGSVTVQSGQTLSDIARTHLPDVPLGTAVAHLQMANDLNSMHISAGQRLVVPTP